MAIASRKGIVLLAAGLLVAAGGLVAIVKQRGERRLDAAMERFETEIGTLDPAVHAPPELADEDNAAFWLQRGAAALDLSEADRAALNELREREGDPGPGVEDLLERQAQALEDLRRAGELRASSWGIRYDAGTYSAMPDLMPHLWAKKVLAADARSGLAAGDRDRVLAAARALAALRRALEREPLIYCQLIAMSVEIAHHDLAQQVLLSDLADAALLDDLAGQLDAGAAGRRLRSAFAVEAALMIHTAGEWIADEGALWRRLRNVPARLWAPMEYASAVDLYYLLAKATELPVPEISGFLSASRSSTPGMRIIADMLVPNMVDGIEKSRASASTRRLAALAIAARVHLLELGDYPEDLGGFPGADLADPYSGGGLRFERRADGSAEVSYPEGEALWGRENPHPSHHRPRFVWHLPAP